jgi:N4-gp56 family major capsid protein
MDGIEGQDKFGTAPIRDAYFALCHTDLTSDLDNVSGFVQKNQYPAPMNALQSEWGAVGNLRFLVSSIGSVSMNASSLGNNVYNIFCVGMEAYACVEQDGYSAQFIYLPPQFSGPLALNSSVGYKFAEVPRITNDLKNSICNKYPEVDKSSLIDLELCLADNRAQAAFAVA